MDALMRPGFACAVTALTAFLTGAALFAAEPILPPLVQEECDEIVVLQPTGDRYGRVVFLRDRKILDERVLIPDRMSFSSTAAGFTVEWDDFATGPAFRRVTAAKISFGVALAPPPAIPGEAPDPRQAWWGQDVNMCRLKRP